MRGDIRVCVHTGYKSATYDSERNPDDESDRKREDWFGLHLFSERRCGGTRGMKARIQRRTLSRVASHALFGFLLLE